MAQLAPKYPIDHAAETDADREARLAWERERIAEADEDIAAGRVFSGEEVQKWLELELAEAEAAMSRETE